MRLGTDPRVNHNLAFTAFAGLASSGLIGLLMHVQFALIVGALRLVGWILRGLVNVAARLILGRPVIGPRARRSPALDASRAGVELRALRELRARLTQV